MKFAKHEVALDLSDSDRIYSVTDEDGQALGFVALKVFPTTNAAGKTKNTEKWAAIHDEVTFGLGYGYGFNSRSTAAQSLVVKN